MLKQRLFKTTPLIFLFLFLFVSLNYWVTHPFTKLFPYDIKRLLELFFLIVFNLFFILNDAYLNKAAQVLIQLDKKIRFSLLALLLIGLMSAALAAKPAFAFLELALYLQLFLFSLFIANYAITWKNSINQQLVNIIVLTALSYVIYIFINFFVLKHVAAKFTFLFPGFMNLRFFAQYQLWTLPLISLPILLTKNKIIKIITYALAIVWFLLALAGAAKGAILSILLVTIIITLLFSGKTKPWLKIQYRILLFTLMALILGALLTLLFKHAFFFEKIAYLKSLQHSQLQLSLKQIGYDIYTRSILWLFAIKLIWHHPLLGVGPMHFSHYRNPIAAHPHNSVLLLASEYGLAALLLILFVLINGLRSWLSFVKTNQGVMLIPLTISLLSGLLYSLLSGVIVMPLSQMMFALIAGWMIGIRFSNDTMPVESKTIKLILFLTFLLSTAFIIAMMIQTLPSLPAKELNFYLAH